jgi:hypothetical protein
MDVIELNTSSIGYLQMVNVPRDILFFKTHYCLRSYELVIC